MGLFHDAQAPPGKMFDAGRIEYPLFLETLAFDVVEAVTRKNFKGPLADDRSAVLPVIDEVHGATAEFTAVAVGVSIAIGSRKCRQERRMNVHDTRLGRIRIDAINEIGRQVAHEAGQNQKIERDTPGEIAGSQPTLKADELEELNLDELLSAGSSMKWFDEGFLTFVPKGELALGNNAYENNPEHNVYLDDFWIDRTEVTNAMYAKCVNAGECDESTWWVSDSKLPGISF